MLFMEIILCIFTFVLLIQNSNSLTSRSRNISKGHAKGLSGIGNSDYYNDIRLNDGYVFRYELVDGTARYEAGDYVINVNGTRELIVNGYYSYRQADEMYLTVYYIVDSKGYHILKTTTSLIRPHLPRDGINENIFSETN